jgi:two-component system chemotaxis response regulator CheB
VIGVLLSGTDGDGTAGFEAIRFHGGLTVAQDPAEAAFPGMPTTAIERVGVDHVLPLAAIADLLAELVGTAPENERGATGIMARDPQREPRDESSVLTDEKRDGRASGLTCPECHGSIWALSEGQLVDFECRVGHRYNPSAFFDAQAERVEDALWTATNVLQERAAALRQFGDRLASSGRLRAEYHARARDVEQQAATIRAVIGELIRSETQETPESA